MSKEWKVLSDPHDFWMGHKHSSSVQSTKEQSFGACGWKQGVQHQLAGKKNI